MQPACHVISNGKIEAAALPGEARIAAFQSSCGSSCMLEKRDHGCDLEAAVRIDALFCCVMHRNCASPPDRGACTGF
jgi:hypothetical protein